MSGEPGEMAREMERVTRALEAARVHVAGLDQADGARDLKDRVAYSPLRSLLEQAERSAETVITYLRGQARS
jgi:hypothetical protein